LRRLLRVEHALAFNAATLLFALPIYVRVYSDPGLPLVLRLVLLVQIVPAALFVLIGAGITRRLGIAAASWWWAILTAGGLVSMLRLVQLELFATTLYGWTWWQKALVALAVSLPLSAGVLIARRQLLSLSRQVTPVVLLVTVSFVAQFAGSYIAGARAAASEARRGDTVIVLILDELGRDVLSLDGAIDRQLYPNLASVAADGLWFTDATTNYGVTCASVPSMLVGRLLAELDCKRTTLAELSPSLLTRLADEYRVTIYEEVLRDCPGQGTRFVCKGIPYFVAEQPHVALAAHLIPPTLRTSVLADVLGGSHTPFAFAMWRDFLADLDRPDARGRAYFVHIALPHAPYIYDENGRLHHSPNEYFAGFPESEPATFANYRLQTRFTDRLFGELVEVLQRRGLYDDATLVVTGDHGPWAPAATTGEISRMSAEVPLILKSPSVRPGTNRVEYQHIDLAPTLVDVLQLRPLEGVDGRSAIRADAAPRVKRFILASHGANPFRSSDWTTYLRRPGEGWQPER
jgi:hypothetical protein